MNIQVKHPNIFMNDFNNTTATPTIKKQNRTKKNSQDKIRKKYNGL